MKREIKFRAWQKQGFKMLYRGLHDRNWYGTPENDENGCNTIREAKPEDEGMLILMQFTGLRDKSGVEIYEGDIIQTVAKDGVRLSKFEVIWDNGSCRFNKRREDNNHFDMDVISEGLKEVIGNIYENSELIMQ